MADLGLAAIVAAVVTTVTALIGVIGYAINRSAARHERAGER